VALCDNLLEKIADSREIERRDYEHWVSEYISTKNTLLAKVDELSADIDQLDFDIDTLTRRINEANNEKAD